jgi:hypothetical protein
LRHATFVLIGIGCCIGIGCSCLCNGSQRKLQPCFTYACVICVNVINPGDGAGHAPPPWAAPATGYQP